MNKQSQWLFEAPPILENTSWSEPPDRQLEFEDEWEVNEWEATQGRFPKVNTLLPKSGLGFYSYRSPSKQFGLPETIKAVMAIGAAWNKAHPNGPRIGIGEISQRGGGKISDHVSHQKGVDVDFFAMRNDGQEKRALAIRSFKNPFPPKNGLDKTAYAHRVRDWLKTQKPGWDFTYYPDYSQPLTQELVNIIRANGILKVQYIFFSDPAIRGVSYWPNHNNHLHVRFYPLGN